MIFYRNLGVGYLKSIRPLFVVLFSFFSAVLTAQNNYKVVATASIFADMAENIAGDQLDIVSIVPIGGDPHLHEPIPRDARLVNQADLILMNGLTFEGWLPELIENSGTEAKKVIITDGVVPIASEQYQGSTDPHAWMDVANGLKYIENIKNAFVELDPDGKEQYEFNYGVYKQQLEDLDQYIQKRMEEIPENQRVLITSHDAFQYYGRKYGIRLESILGVSTDAEAQTSDIMRLNKVIQSTQVPAVFIESTINPKLLEQIAKDNGVRIGGKLFADSIGDEASEAPSYYDMLKYNTDVIVEALKVVKSNEDEPVTEAEGTPVWLYFVIGIALIGLLLLLPRLIKS
ncbi:MAG: zinc ABC transporter substrate-binding protein [Bacteroidota bacterium]